MMYGNKKKMKGIKSGEMKLPNKAPFVQYVNKKKKISGGK